MNYYNEPNARITITKESGSVLKFNTVNSVRITESVRELGDSAVVVLPRKWKKLNGKNVLNYLSVGDRVLIELGNDGEYAAEFKGYLGEIQSDAPLKLMIDDDFYPLKRNSTKKTFDKVTLRELLNYIAPGYEIKCPDVELGKYQISEVSSYRVITDLKESFGLFSYIRDGVLFCQFAYDVRGLGSLHTYTIGVNTVKGKNKLVYHRAEDVKVKVRAIANPRTGKKISVEVGSKDPAATLRTLNYGDVSKSQLQEFAEKAYSSLAFDGYSGTITGFSRPQTRAGDTLRIVDEQEPERAGDYVIEKVVVDYNLTSGYKRKNTLSFQV